MKEFEIWQEGYAATGESSPASFIGKATGVDFADACKNFQHPNGDKLKLDGHYDYPSIWGCQLYDNEVEARKSFG